MTADGSIFTQNWRQYVSLGYSPIPRWTDPSVAPFPKGWSDYCERTADTALFAQWSRVKAANITLCTGYNGLIAIDLDADRQDCFEALSDLLPAARHARRGSKGYALLLRHESGQPVRIEHPVVWGGETWSSRFPLLEFKALGHNITVPPSYHAKTRKQYVWLYLSGVFDPQSFDAARHPGERAGFTVPPAVKHLAVIGGAKIEEIKRVFSKRFSPKPPERPGRTIKGRGSSPNGGSKRLARYAGRAYQGACCDLSQIRSGRNTALNEIAYRLCWTAPHVGGQEAFIDGLIAAARINGLLKEDGLHSVLATAYSGYRAGLHAGVQPPVLLDRPWNNVPAETDLGKPSVEKQGKPPAERDFGKPSAEMDFGKPSIEADAGQLPVERAGSRR
jgi:hypothetical protein